MNKAVPWNISGVGFDAREAAREAARRQGKSLGEWLHGVIADHAADLGLEPHNVGDQDRIEAVTAKLERLSSRSSDFERRGRQARSDDEPRSRTPRRESIRDDEASSFRRPSTRRDPDAALEAHRARRAAPVIEETEFLLEEAVDAMERRASRSERRTDDALASFAKLLESAETKRNSERDAVRELAEKLSSIEAKLTEKPSQDETPIKGALARLEARLETIGRRSSAETSARHGHNASFGQRGENEPIRRLEDKLNTILDAISAKHAEPASPTMPRFERPLENRRLGDAIAEISRRQRVLEDPRVAAESLYAEPRRTRPVLPHAPVQEAPWQNSLAAMQSEISALAGSIESMRRDVIRQREAPPDREPDLDGLRAEMGSMSQTLRELSPRGEVTNLQSSIEGLMNRIEASRNQGVQDNILRPVEAMIGDLRHSLPTIDQRSAIGDLEREVQSIAQKVDGLSDASAPALSRLQNQMEEIRELLAITAERPLAVEQIAKQITALATQVERAAALPGDYRDLGAAADDVRALIANPPGAAALGKIESRLDALAHKLDSISGISDNASDVAGLERLVRDLAQKIEAVGEPGADSAAVEALQSQIELLSARFARSEEGLASLSKLERSMRDLFTHLDKKQANSSADGKTDARTQSTLSAVHQMLEHVVGRMSAMEAEMTSIRRKEPAAELPAAKIAIGSTPKAVKPTRLSTPDLTLGGADPLLAPLFAQKTAAPSKKAAPVTPRPTHSGPDEEAGRADFIAAARRAAKSAQSDPSVAAMRATPTSETETRASLLAKSRDYVSTHKRPVLLSIAAVFVVLGTMAIVQRMTFGTGDTQIASVEPPAKISRMADDSYRPAAPKPPTAATKDDLSPSALPKGARALAAQIPGSDPVQTASIQSLPSFAAQGAAQAAARPSLPAGLLTKAQAGDSGAEFELATRYADGKSVPRDLKMAASWYEKAADKGSAPAQYRLAALYEKGLGVTQDKARARELYLKAAEAGNPRAMHNLAVLMADGNGKPDYASAAAWFSKAAAYGVHDSQYNLAVLLARGLGTGQSLVQSYKWFAVAAAQNDTDAAKKRDEVGDKLNANDLAVAKALAASFQPRTANVAATDVTPPPGGWDSIGASSHINSARSKISSL